MRGSNPRRIHQSALLWESWRFLQIKFNPPRPLRQCGNMRHLVKGSDDQLTRSSSILPSRTSEVCKSAWLVSAATGNSYKFTVGRDTPEPIRSERLCKTPLRRDGQRTENPQSLDVGSVKMTQIRRFAPCPPSDDFPRWNETSASGSGVVGLI